jgi:hypothetical protein
MTGPRKRYQIPLVVDWKNWFEYRYKNSRESRIVKVSEGKPAGVGVFQHFREKQTAKDESLQLLFE